MYKEEIIVLCIENLPQRRVNLVEDDLGIYSIFTKEEIDIASTEKPPGDSQEIWKMFFDGPSSQHGNGVGVVLHSDFGKRRTFSFWLNFIYTNNTT